MGVGVCLGGKRWWSGRWSRSRNTAFLLKASRSSARLARKFLVSYLSGLGSGSHVCLHPPCGPRVPLCVNTQHSTQEGAGNQDFVIICVNVFEVW